MYCVVSCLTITGDPKARTRCAERLGACSGTSVGHPHQRWLYAPMLMPPMSLRSQALRLRLASRPAVGSMFFVQQSARGCSNGLRRQLPTNVPGSSALESQEDWIAVYPPVIGSSHPPWSRTRGNFRPIRVGRGAFCRWYRVRYMPPSRVSTRLWPIRQRNCVSINAWDSSRRSGIPCCGQDCYCKKSFVRGLKIHSRPRFASPATSRTGPPLS